MALPFIVQESNNDCALACFAMIYQYYYKQQLELNNLKQLCQLSEAKGLNLLELKQLGDKFNLNLKIYKISYEELTILEITNPIILQIINENLDYHFIVIYKKKKNQILIADPSANNLIWCKLSDFSKNFTGIIVNCLKTQKINKIKPTIKKFNLFSIPNYFVYTVNILLTHVFLVITFFITQICYKIFINQIIVNNNFDIALLLLVSFFVINIIYQLINYLFEKLSKIFYFYFAKFLIDYFYQKWFSLKLTSVKNFNNSYYLQIYQDIASITNVVTNNILELIISFITMILVSVIMIRTSLVLWGFTIFTGVINLLFNLVVMKTQMPFIQNSINKKMQLQNTIINTNQNYEDSYYRNLLFHLENKLNIKTDRALKIDYILEKNKINNHFNVSFIKQFLNFITLYLLLNFIIDKTLMFSQLIFISSINIYILNFFYNIGSFAYSYPEFKRAYHRFSNFVNIANREGKNVKLVSSSKMYKEINFVNCQFKIGNKIIFNNLNLKFSQHSFLIGSNGIGKTSLLSLICGKHEVSKGVVLFDQIKKNDIHWHILEKECIYISSNSNVMLGSVLENLCSFEITETKLLIFKNLRMELILDQFNLRISDYCHSYSDNLSLGQKQAIVFLSLFFHNWKIILLDEILSNIKFELKIYLIEMLRKYFADAIIIYISHDLLLTKMFDHIIDLNRVEQC